MTSSMTEASGFGAYPGSWNFVASADNRDWIRSATVRAAGYVGPPILEVYTLKTVPSGQER